ncbi:MAG: GerW family sporulation protein [Bacteroides sp.]|nr:GerW family sporulation protein [Bacillota bacterium]MCM1393924.1 GerW family sporulation protein [[Eubacterium] siraeum]MCM1455909.1 GerW family sporulation protein [Bacteroides sp.]
MDNLDEVLKRTLDSVRYAAENDDVIGKPFVTSDGTVIMSVNKLSYGFVVGGGEYGEPKNNLPAYPYSAVSGGGVTLTPIGFLICGREKRFVSVDKEGGANKWVELLGNIIETIKKD